MDTDRAVGEVVNIGNDHEITIEELASLVRQRTSSASAVHYIPYDQAYEPGFEDMAQRVPSLEKLVQLTDFRPSTPLTVIIDKVAVHLSAKSKLVQTIQD
jgi:UDP-glucose 4-epimerase